MSTPTHTTDAQVARTCLWLVFLALAAMGSLWVIAVWFTSLDCPKLWHLVAGPIAFAAEVRLIWRALGRLQDLDKRAVS